MSWHDSVPEAEKKDSVLAPLACDVCLVKDKTSTVAAAEDVKGDEPEGGAVPAADDSAAVSPVSPEVSHRYALLNCSAIGTGQASSSARHASPDELDLSVPDATRQPQPIQLAHLRVPIACRAQARGY